MSDIIYRTAGAWGPGLGADLAAAQVDMNFWALYSLIVAMQNTGPVEISYFTVTGNQMWITMSDHYVFGPYLIPQAVWNFRGAWTPNNSYNINDVFTVSGEVLYGGGAVYLCIYPQLNSGSSFYAGANDGEGHNYYAQLLAAAPNPIPNNGLPGQMLQWTGVESPGNMPWAWDYIKRNIALYLEEAPNPLEEVLRYTFTESTQFAIDFAGSYGNCGTDTTTTQVYEVYQNGANIGSVNFAPSPHASFTAPTVVTFAAGDVMTILAPSVPDPHLTQVAFTLMGVVVLP